MNNPMMPVAWTKSYGKGARVFTTTMGAATDLPDAGVRRMLVNACFWALGLERRIKPGLNIEFVRDYHPTPFKFGGYLRGLKPGDR